MPVPSVPASPQRFTITPITQKPCVTCHRPLRYKLIDGGKRAGAPGGKTIPWHATEDRPHNCHEPATTATNQAPPPVPLTVPLTTYSGFDPIDPPSGPQPPPTPPPPPNPLPASGIIGAMWPELAPKIAELISASVSQYIQPKPALVIHQFQPPPPPIPGAATPAPEICHRLFPELLYKMSLPETPSACGVWLIGPSRSGKSHAFRQAVRALGYDTSEEMSLAPGMTAFALLGFMSPQLSGPPLYVSTAFRRAYQNGYPLLLDEIDKAMGEVLAVMQSGVDAPSMAFPDGMVPRHPKFKLVIGSPTAGLGPTAAYAASKPLPVDFRARFLRIDWQYDDAMELAITLSINPDAGPWVEWVQKARRFADNELGGKFVITPGVSYQGARMLGMMMAGHQSQDLETFAQEVTAAKWDLDRATWRRLLDHCPLPAVVVKTQTA